MNLVFKKELPGMKLNQIKLFKNMVRYGVAEKSGCAAAKEDSGATGCSPKEYAGTLAS
jgi:hypothetical protein